MSLEVDLSDPHEAMLAQLRDEHGEGIDEHGNDIDSYLRQRVEAEIHKSYQQLREGETTW
jgi:hypothetical protein